MTVFFSRFRLVRCVYVYRLLLITCLFAVCLPETAVAWTQSLMMNPVRIIFKERQRAVNVKVINSSKFPVTYMVSLVTMRKDENGNMYEADIETEQEKLTRKMIRFSPRRATVEPGKRQIVKLMVRKPKDLPPGEYRTRLRLTPLPPEIPLVNNGGQGMINLDVIVASTYPIVIQHGYPEAEVSPQTLQLKKSSLAPSGIAAEVSFSRSGELSAFGNVRVMFIPKDEPKKIRQIGLLQGLAIYLPESERSMQIPLVNITQDELSGGTVRVAFQPDTGVVEKRKKRSKIRSRDFLLQ